MAPISYSRVRMAELCLSAAHTVNGVSRIHSEILKTNVFRDYAEYAPGKFTSVTNGVTHIRWLALCNPALASLIKEAIGERFLKEPESLGDLLKFKDDASFLDSLAEVKYANAVRFSEKCSEHGGVYPDPTSLIDVQIKRFHEYKRQLMNALKILYLYVGIKSGLFADLPSVTFVFGGKAAQE